MNNFFTLVKKDCTKSTDFISRLLGWNAKNDETRAISTPEIRDMSPKTLSIYVLAVSHADQLQRSFVYKSKQHPPIPRDAESQKADKRFRQILCMQKRVVWIGAQQSYQFKKLAAMLTGEHRGALDKSRMMYNIKHLLALSRRGTLLRLKSEIGAGAFHSPHEASPARIPDDTHPRGLSRQYLSRMNGASALLFPGQSYSYRNDTPTKKKINGNAKPPTGVGGPASSYSTAWRVVARVVSMPRRLWCLGSVATAPYHLNFKRIPCSDRTILRVRSWRPTTDCIKMNEGEGQTQAEPMSKPLVTKMIHDEKQQSMKVWIKRNPAVGPHANARQNRAIIA